MADIQKPDMSKQWANSGSKTPPADSLINAGWSTGDIPTNTDFNYIDNRQDQGIAYILQKGVPEWDASTEYRAGKSIVQRNGCLWVCKVTHSNVSPETSPSNWRPYNGVITPTAYGAVGDGATVDTASFSNLANNYETTLQHGTYRVADVQYTSYGISGKGVSCRLKAASSAGAVILLGLNGVPTAWTAREISNLVIDGNAKASIGIKYSAPASSEQAGRWTIRDVAITDCSYGIYKPNGNIGNRYYNLDVSNCAYGYYAVGQTSPLMHAGNDLFYGGQFSTCTQAGVYIESPQAGTGGTKFDGTIFQGIPGFGVFVKGFADSYAPLEFNNVWFEENATSTLTNINGTDYAPKDMYVEDSTNVILRNSSMPKKYQFVNSRVLIDGCTFNDGPNILGSVDNNSVIAVKNVVIDGGQHKITVESLLGSRRSSGNQAQSHYAPPRVVANGVFPVANKLQALSYDGAGPFVFTGSPNVNGVSVADGRIFPTCCEVVVPAGKTLTQPAVTVTAGKWVVFSLDAKLVAGNTASLLITGDAPLVVGLEGLLTTQWKTIASVCKVSGTAGVQLYLIGGASDTTLRLSAEQIMQFDTEQEAIDYYNQRSYYK